MLTMIQVLNRAGFYYFEQTCNTNYYEVQIHSTNCENDYRLLEIENEKGKFK